MVQKRGKQNKTKKTNEGSWVLLRIKKEASVTVYIYFEMCACCVLFFTNYLPTHLSDLSIFPMNSSCFRCLYLAQVKRLDGWLERVPNLNSEITAHLASRIESTKAQACLQMH